jgi:benzodiazapine receptor
MTIVVESVGEAGLLVAVVGFIFRISLERSKAYTSSWYETGKQWVPGTPPNYMFGIVWAFLYACICAAAWHYVKNQTPSTDADIYIVVFLILGLSLQAWSPLFFEMKRPGWAFVVLLTSFACALINMILAVIQEEY